LEEAPSVGGQNIFDDLRCDINLAADDLAIIDNTAGTVVNVAEVCFVAPIPGAAGYARVPANQGGSLAGNLGENTYIFVSCTADVRRRTLAHEFGHALTNSGDTQTPKYVFFPSGGGTSAHDSSVDDGRRIRHSTEATAWTYRPPGSLNAAANRLLPGCP